METQVEPRSTASIQPEPRFARETLGHALDQLRPLAEAHYRAIFKHLDDFPIAIDYDRALQMEKSGALWLFTARIGGDLVGFGIYVVTSSMFHSSLKMAIQDAMHLPTKREGDLGSRFARYCHQCLRTGGVQVVQQHARATDVNRSRLEDFGFELFDHLYVKRLIGH